MTELLVQVGLSNLLLSAALAAVAYAVHRRGRYPALAHLLWLFVLVKVITPPLLTVPLTLGPAGAGALAITTGANAVASAAAVVGEPVGLEAAAAWLAAQATTIVLGIWLAGSVLVLTASLLRVRRFGRLLGVTSAPAPASIQALAQSVARPLGLRSAPTIYLSSARVSPMTWWVGGRIRIILPEALLRSVDGPGLSWVLAHELAHVKRRDHLVRWLEWFACVAFWWNPVVWWARRNLRLDEEDACDAFVLEHIDGQPRSYARTLLAAVEVMAEPGARAPSLATGIDAARSLERRLTRIISPGGMRKAPRWLVGGLAAVALMLTTVGVGGATGEMADADQTAQAGGSEVGQRLDEIGSDGERYGLVSADTAATSRGQRIVGTNRADELRGTDAADIMSGRKGADVIRGGKGGDIIAGGAGRDVIDGGPGNDVIDGGPGKDTLKGGAGNDVIRAWADGVADRIDCGAGDRDRAVVDSSDTTRRCEAVVLRDPS